MSKKLLRNNMTLELVKKAIEKIDNKYFINIGAYDLSIEDWKNLIAYLNDTYKIVFKEYVSNQEYEKINYESLLSFWKGDTENGYMAVIDLETILINCYFNGINDLDFDVIYNDIMDDGNLNKIINFVSSMSNIIDKPFYLEEDDYGRENKLVEIYKNKVLIIDRNNS